MPMFAATVARIMRGAHWGSLHASDRICESEYTSPLEVVIRAHESHQRWWLIWPCPTSPRTSQRKCENEPLRHRKHMQCEWDHSRQMSQHDPTDVCDHSCVYLQRWLIYCIVQNQLADHEEWWMVGMQLWLAKIVIQYMHCIRLRMLRRNLDTELEVVAWKLGRRKQFWVGVFRT